jgi:hypothetical protein
MSDAMHDVMPEQYAMVIREMIRHENDLTNHRIMWLLIGEGFMANAYVTAKAEGGSKVFLLSLVGILIALSAFLMLYRSYQARGYLTFLGLHAKRGTLPEINLPLMGWPRIRIKGWWNDVWVCQWFKHYRDLFEPWLLLPYVFISLWMTSLLYAQIKLHVAVVLMLGMMLSAAILSACSILLVRSQNKENTEG